jgi:hypothetical protein
VGDSSPCLLHARGSVIASVWWLTRCLPWQNEHTIEFVIKILSLTLNLHVLLFFDTVHPYLDADMTAAAPGGSIVRDATSPGTSYVDWSDPQVWDLFPASPPLPRPFNLRTCPLF